MLRAHLTKVGYNDRALCKRLGIGFDDISITEASGLSRHIFIKPSHITRLLEYVREGPYRYVYQQSLACAGVDGTLKARFTAPPLRGSIHAKTGFMSHVNALSGYAKTGRGHPVTFSIIVNNALKSAKQCRGYIDDILMRLLAYF